jgi:DNA modification methylase
MANRLILGDNLEILKTLDSETVNLIYLDPPFFFNRNYEVIWGDDGSGPLERRNRPLYRMAERTCRTDAPHPETHWKHIFALRLVR